MELLFQYLRSVRPLMDDDKYKRMQKLVEEFRSSIGKKLQRYLVLKSWWATNYVSKYIFIRVIIELNNDVYFNYHDLSLILCQI